MDSTIFTMFVVLTLTALLMLAVVNRLARQKSGLDHAYFEKEWQKIEKLITMGETGWHVAVMNADKLLDHALRTRRYHGETMGERLKAASKANLFRKREAVWDAHKLRNRLAHESNVGLNQIQVRRAIAAFKSALKDVGAL